VDAEARRVKLLGIPLLPCAFLAVSVAYGLWIRPRRNRWAATDNELTKTPPGAAAHPRRRPLSRAGPTTYRRHDWGVGWRQKSVTPSVSWATLSRPARAYRVFHVSWSVAGLASLGYIWACAATRRRDRKLGASVAFLLIEGLGLIVGGGDCPMGPFQEQLGDPVPFFELVLPPRAAKAAVPILAGASVAGMLAVVLRPPSLPITAPRATREG
jgi:hypothetical protein